MVAGASLWILSSYVLLFFVSSVVTYYGYDLANDKVCSSNSKREMTLSMSRSFLIRDGGRLLSNWRGVQSFRCKWKVKSDGGQIGIVGVIQLLQFRRSNFSDCTDYIQFKEAKEVSPRPMLCGSMMFGHYISANGSFIPPMPAVAPSPAPPTPPTLVNPGGSILTSTKRPHNSWAGLVSRGSAVDPKGELKTTVYVEAKPLRTDEMLELVIVFSGFQECDGRITPPGLFHCGYGLCISASLVNDGFVNCPFGDCIDEKNCTAALASNKTLKLLGNPIEGLSTGETATSSVFGLLVVIAICGCIYFLIRRSKKKSEPTPPEGEAAACPTQPTNGEYVGIPSNTGMQNAEQPSAVPFQQPPPGAPSIGFCVIPTGGLPPAGAPYPGAAVPMPYPPQPDQYAGAAAPMLYPPQPDQYAGATAPMPYPPQPQQYPTAP